MFRTDMWITLSRDCVHFSENKSSTVVVVFTKSGNYTVFTEVTNELHAEPAKEALKQVLYVQEVIEGLKLILPSEAYNKEYKKTKEVGSKDVLILPTANEEKDGLILPVQNEGKEGILSTPSTKCKPALDEEFSGFAWFDPVASSTGELAFKVK